MPSISTSIEISAPPETVFPYLHEDSRRKRWLSGYVDSIPQSLGEFGVNSRFVDRLQLGDRQIEMETRVTRFEPPAEFAYAASNDNVDTDMCFTLSPTDSGCQLHLEFTITTKGFFSGMKSMFLSGILKEQTGQNLEQLKQVVEEDQS